MARRRRVYTKKRSVDPHYGSELVSQIINAVMLDGQKSTAEKIVYAAIEKANSGSDNVDPLEILTRGIENSKPRLEVRPRRVGGATYQVPGEVPVSRQEALAIRWVVSFARKRKGTPMHVALSNELRDAANNSGSAVRRRDEMHKTAQANRAFAHFRW